MKKLFRSIGFLIMFFLPATSFGIGFEFSLGGWYQQPSGTLSFDKTTKADDLDLELAIVADLDVGEFLGALGDQVADPA